jgi:AcrR family transcriptional regulator
VPETSLSAEQLPSTALASALPRRTAGTRSRAGNAMARTRAGLLDGALRAVTLHGIRRTTMHDIAAYAGIAKATLYNHFRTKDDVLAALVESQVRALAAECRPLPLADALAHAAGRVSEHPALRRVLAAEPRVLAGLVAPAPHSVAWSAAREEVRSILAEHGRGGADLVLRWLTTFLGRPGEPEAIRAQADLLAVALPAAGASQEG